MTNKNELLTQSKDGRCGRGGNGGGEDAVKLSVDGHVLRLAWVSEHVSPYADEITPASFSLLIRFNFANDFVKSFFGSDTDCLVSLTRVCDFIWCILFNWIWLLLWRKRGGGGRGGGSRFNGLWDSISDRLKWFDGLLDDLNEESEEL